MCDFDSIKIGRASQSIRSHFLPKLLLTGKRIFAAQKKESMFSFGIFTTYLPYLIIGIAYAFYYAIALLSGGVQITEKKEQDNYSIAHTISYQAKEKKDNTLQISFEQQVFAAQTIKSIPSSTIGSATAIFSVLLPKSRFGYSLFSRPPPAFV